MSWQNDTEFALTDIFNIYIASGNTENPGDFSSPGSTWSEIVLKQLQLKDRYILTASFRRDGSSKFSAINRYANFASGAFAWMSPNSQGPEIRLEMPFLLTPFPLL